MKPAGSPLLRNRRTHFVVHFVSSQHRSLRFTCTQAPPATAQAARSPAYNLGKNQRQHGLEYLNRFAHPGLASQPLLTLPNILKNKEKKYQSREGEVALVEIVFSSDSPGLFNALKISNGFHLCSPGPLCAPVLLPLCPSARGHPCLCWEPREAGLGEPGQARILRPAFMLPVQR